jgi:hypothetical protein
MIQRVSLDRYSAYLGSFFFLACSLILWFASIEKEQHFDLDSYGYERIALHALDSFELKDPTYDDVPIQVGGYPLIIAILYALCGTHYQVLIVFQILLALATCFLVWSCAAQLFDAQAGRIAFLLSSINLGYLVFAQFFLTEICAVFLLTLFLERFILFLKTRSMAALSIASGAFGICLIIKPAPLFFAPIIAGFLFSLVGLDRAVFSRVIFFMTAPMCVLVLYNYYKFGAAQLAPTAQENMYFYVLAKLKQTEHQKPLQEIYKEIESTFDSYKRSDMRRWEKSKDEFFWFLIYRRILIARLWLESAAKTIGGLYTSQLKLLLNPALKGTPTSLLSAQGNGIQKIDNYIGNGALYPAVRYIGWLEFIFNIVRSIFILFALGALAFRKDYWLMLFFVTFCAYFIAVTGHDGCARYRLVIEPMLTIFASFGILFFYELLMRVRRTNRVLLSVDS